MTVSAAWRRRRKKDGGRDSGSVTQTVAPEADSLLERMGALQLPPPGDFLEHHDAIDVLKRFEKQAYLSADACDEEVQRLKKEIRETASRRCKEIPPRHPTT